MGRHKGLSDVQAAARRRAIAERCRQGATYQELRAEFGVSDPTICKSLRENGVSASHLRGCVVWRDCPDHLREAYRILVKHKKIPAREARAMLEAVRP